MKKKFEMPKLITVIFPKEDIIVTSIGGDDDNPALEDPEDPE